MNLVGREQLEFDDNLFRALTVSETYSGTVLCRQLYLASPEEGVRGEAAWVWGHGQR